MTSHPDSHHLPTRRILARVAPEDFVGRTRELKRMTSLAQHRTRPRGLLLLAAPAAGASELLRQAYDQLFQQRGGPAPIYFALSRDDSTTVGAAHRFLYTFLLQLIAHRRGAARLLDAPPTMHDLVELAAASDYEWVARLVQAYDRERASGDQRTLLRLCLGAPQQAAACGSRTIVMFDDAHLADQLHGEASFGAELARVAIAAEVPFVLAGLRRRMLGLYIELNERAPFDGMEILHLPQLGDDEARTLIEKLARLHRIEVHDETRDLLVQQLTGTPFYITALMQAAQAQGRGLTSFRECQQVYVDELMGGRMNRRFHALLEEIAPVVTQRRALVRMLHEAAMTDGGKSPVEVWRRKLNWEAVELQRIMSELHIYELANLNSTVIEIGSSLVWRDYLRTSYRLEVAAEPRALVVANTLIEILKRAPQTMARKYRREAALKVPELLLRFNFQRIPSSLLDYDRFAQAYKGVKAEEMAAGLDAETDLTRLPQMVHTASCASLYPPMLQAGDEERCVAGHGFDTSPYTDANQVVWLVAEIESKQQAGRALTEEWCERLMQMAQACRFGSVRLWLIAPEGFTEEACQLLKQRGAFGSSIQQLELLAARISPDLALVKRPTTARDEYEMVIPMGRDTELIAAHTIEQIARRLEFQPEAINQIKTALIEACINAAEHSNCPDRKIYQRFLVEDDKLVITVSSRGIAISPFAVSNGQIANSNESNGSPKGRRGWGLKLIRTLMDEVEFERVDDGTRLRMTKYLRKQEGN